MLRRLAAGAAAAGALGLAIVIRVHNARHYPADWGFDATYNWQYIAALARRWHLPPPDAGWSTGDPPLYFALSAALVRLAPNRLVWVPLLNVGLGLAIAGLAALWVRRVAPEAPLRAALAAGLVLFLPAHVHMSAMVNEEMLAAALGSVALLAVARPGPRGAPAAALGGVPPLPISWQRSLLAGAAAGLAWLSKLTGLLAVATVGLTLLHDAWRSRPGARRRPGARPGPLLQRALAALLVAALVGGWFYARNRILYGYFQPHGLPAHQVMFRMPPGERGVLDYLRVPVSTFTDPQLLDPDLLHSVWGSTYAAVWFDAHRFFLPTGSAAVRRLGTALLLLGLLPTAAFGVGLVRGAHRAWHGERADFALVTLTALTLLGYAVYTWANPWFVVLKGTTLLGLCLPYAVYASGTLAAWWQRSRGAALAVGAWLVLLVVGVTVSCTFDAFFPRTEVPGLRWERSLTP